MLQGRPLPRLDPSLVWEAPQEESPDVRSKGSRVAALSVSPEYQLLAVCVGEPTGSDCRVLLFSYAQQDFQTHWHHAKSESVPAVAGAGAGAGGLGGTASLGPGSERTVRDDPLAGSESPFKLITILGASGSTGTSMFTVGTGSCQWSLSLSTGGQNLVTFLPSPPQQRPPGPTSTLALRLGVSGSDVNIKSRPPVPQPEVDSQEAVRVGIHPHPQAAAGTYQPEWHRCYLGGA